MTSARDSLDGCAATPGTRPWWRLWLRWEVGLLVLLVLGIYFTRLTHLPVCGEESRRATVGLWMKSSGDWVVPRQQGDPFFMSSRPPLQNWIIAGLGLVRGRVDPAAVRLPSTVAVLLTVLLVYGYASTFLSRLGAFAAGLVHATLVQVMQLGRLGETDALFTLFLGGALLAWHAGFVRKWPATCTWCIAYLMVALATLTKGAQAPVYFAASVGAYLLVTRRWRYALSWPHACGILLYLLVLGGWQVPFCLRIGMAGVRHIYGGDVAMHFSDRRWTAILEHVLAYPFDMLSCLLPWSLLLLVYAGRGFRTSLKPMREHVTFLVGCIVVTFPTVWLAPTARTRFFMPLYPCFAVLIGVVVQRCLEPGRPASLRKVWAAYQVFLASLMLVSGLVVPAGNAALELGQPVWFAVVYGVVAAVLAVVTWLSRGAETPLKRVAGLVSVAVFLGLTVTGVRLNREILRSENAAEAMADLKAQLPADARMVSFGPMHHLFVYHYGKPIERLPMPGPGGTPPGDVTYFCSMHPVEFAHERLAAISCDRRRRPDPVHVAYVGRRP